MGRRNSPTALDLQAGPGALGGAANKSRRDTPAPSDPLKLGTGALGSPLGVNNALLASILTLR